MTETVTTAPNRMARRRERTRQQILDAVETVILEHGYAEASAEAIAELADLGRSTFYNHFDNKQDAVLAMLIQHYHEYGDAAYVPLEETRDRAVSVVRSASRIFKAMASDPLTRQLAERPRLLAKAIAESQMEFLVRDFTEGVMQGRFRFAVSPESLATLLNWSYVGMLIRAINQDAIEDTSREWARFLLLNLGIGHDDIEDVVDTALRG
ncbi:MAG: TetR/AcrR family transcriptional regulator [Halioglobus sp.]|nr:TetR/AcrR family transcriptional regulator [Halioglobus sp.]